MKKLISVLAGCSIAALALSGCTADPTPSPGATASGSTSSTAVAQQSLNQALHDQLPDSIKSSGTITSVNTGSFPPYTVVDANNVTGASADIGVALGQILGVTVEHKTVDGLASELSGMQAKRYDLAIGPTGDFLERQKQATFVDWVKEYVVFAVQQGNPQGIDGIDTVCGKKIAVQAAGSAEKVVKAQSDKCVAAGKPAVEVQSYKDQPSSILAVQSKRADAFFSSQAPLTYFVQQSKGQLELAGVGKPNGFSDLFQGLMVPAGSPLGDTMLQAFKIMKDNGTYGTIMKKWGLEGNMIPEPGINLAKS